MGRRDTHEWASRTRTWSRGISATPAGSTSAPPATWWRRFRTRSLRGAGLDAIHNGRLRPPHRSDASARAARRGPRRSAAVTVTPAQQQWPTKRTDRVASDQPAKVKGKIVLVGKAATIPVDFTPPRSAGTTPKSAPNSTHQSRRRRRTRRRAASTPDRSRLTPSRSTRWWTPGWCQRRAGARQRRGREHGQIRAFHNRTYDVEKAVPP